MDEIKTKREFKFRAFNKVSKKMYTMYGFTLNTSGEIVAQNENEVMQFTGLKDINDVEIYEGDILKHQGIVAWNDVEHCWSAIDLNWNDRREWHDIEYLTSPFIVIGNIYENSDLLS